MKLSTFLIRTSGPLLAAGVAALATPADASWKHATGICQPETTTDNGKLSFGQWGVFNDATTTATVQCNGDTAFATGNAWIGIYDRHASVDSLCTLMWVDGLHNIVWQQSNRTNASSGGIQWLHFAPPPGTGTIVQARCSLPAWNSAGGHSWLSALVY